MGWGQITELQILAPVIPGCVTRDKLLGFSELNVLFCQRGNSPTYLIILV